MLAGRRLLADRTGALFSPDTGTLVVADLHLEKASAFAAKGWLLPPYDTRETLSRLADAIAAYAPHTVIALGDSLHDPDGAGRIDDEDLERLGALQAGRRWVWVTGNHDPEIAGTLGGEVRESETLAGIRLVHAPMAGGAYALIAGHLHPAARLAVRGTSIRRPCFASDATRLILPAFGAFTGGLNVLDPAIAGLLVPSRLQVLMLGEASAYPVPVNRLIPD